MKKISTLFKKNPDNLALVTTEVDPENEWAIKGEGRATRKWDGTACAVISGEIYKRYDVKTGKSAPEGSIPCQEPDAITGHWPHWIKCDRNKKEDKYFFEAYDRSNIDPDGTYELIGEKVNGNNEDIIGHFLIKHGSNTYCLTDMSHEGIGSFLSTTPIEGIVFHHPDGRMCKIRRKDFGFDWPIKPTYTLK